jgi:LysM repeat protein
MKKEFGLAVILAVLFFKSAVIVSWGATPAEIAAQQEAEDRYKRLAATVEDLKETLVAQQKRLAALADEIRGLREEATRASHNAVSPETIKQLAEKIQEVDRKREADNKLTQETLAKLQKGLTASLASPRTTPKTNSVAKVEASGSVPSGSDRMVEYKIKKNDTLSLIVKDVNEQGEKITQKQVRDANPNVDWDRLQIGQRILIPLPAQAKASK